jgi:hypothetical protein
MIFTLHQYIGIEVSKELGTYQCLIKEYDEGLKNLYISLGLQEKTVKGMNH